MQYTHFKTLLFSEETNFCEKMVNFSNIFPSHKKTALPVDVKLSVHNCPSLRYILMLTILFYMLCLASLTQVFEGRYKWVMLSCHTPLVYYHGPDG